MTRIVAISAAALMCSCSFSVGARVKYAVMGFSADCEAGVCCYGI